MYSPALQLSTLKQFVSEIVTRGSGDRNPKEFGDTKKRNVHGLGETLFSPLTVVLSRFSKTSKKTEGA